MSLNDIQYLTNTIFRCDAYTYLVCNICKHIINFFINCKLVHYKLFLEKNIYMNVTHQVLPSVELCETNDRY